MSEDTQENASPATQQQPQAIDQHVHNSSTQNPSVRDAPSSRGRQPIVLCAKATKCVVSQQPPHQKTLELHNTKTPLRPHRSLQKHASVLQHAQPSTHRLLFRPLIPAISVAPAPWPLTQDDPIPDDPLELVPLEIPEDATTSQEQQLFTNAVLLLQRMTPRRLTSEQPVPTGVGCHARCVPVQASVPRCYRVTCEDGMAVARLLLPIWSAALCSLVGCPPAELVVVPLYEHTLLVSACSNPAAMAAMAAAALAAQEDDEGGVLLPEGVVIKEVPTPASQRWMQWASYAGMGVVCHNAHVDVCACLARVLYSPVV